MQKNLIAIWVDCQLKYNRELLYDGLAQFSRSGGISVTITDEERRLLAAVHADPELRKRIQVILEAPELPAAFPAKPPETPQ